MEIEIKLFNNREYFCSNSIIGKTYENVATTLKFYLTDEMLNKHFYIEFEKANGDKVSTLELIKNEDKTVTYKIPNSLLDHKGELKAEVVLRDLNGLVYKTYTMTFNILNSINANEEISKQNPDFISEAQKVIDLIDITGDGSKYLSNDGTYKEVSSGSSDYNDLINIPFKNVGGTEDSPIYLRELQTGAYLLNGICKPYNGSDATMTASSAITYVNHFDTVTAVQIFYPPYNQVQYFEVYDDNYINNTVMLNNLATKEYVDNAIANALNS